jgi:hypothetical protein
VRGLLCPSPLGFPGDRLASDAFEDLSPERGFPGETHGEVRFAGIKRAKGLAAEPAEVRVCPAAVGRGGSHRPVAEPGAEVVGGRVVAFGDHRRGDRVDRDEPAGIVGDAVLVAGDAQRRQRPVVGAGAEGTVAVEGVERVPVTDRNRFGRIERAAGDCGGVGRQGDDLDRRGHDARHLGVVCQVVPAVFRHDRDGVAVRGQSGPERREGPLTSG